MSTEKKTPVTVTAKSSPATTTSSSKYVPESVLKKRKTAEALLLKHKAASIATHKKNRANRKAIFKRAEKYVAEYRSVERDSVRQKRIAKNAGNFYVAPEAKLAFVVRIRGINAVAAKTRKILQILRLRQIHNGVFIRLNKATINLLRYVEPYIIWGYPSLKSVSDLIYKRGFGIVNKNRIPLTDNKIIEQSLGEHGIACIEDLIHEIYTVGGNFKTANKFLYPFKLSSPLGGFNSIVKHYVEGGDSGNREDDINALIKKMN